ncbi:MAG: ATP-binding protein [Anaerolineae bacterium]
MRVKEWPKIEDVREAKVGQLFERLGAEIEPRELASVLVAMANADGGTAAIGFEEDGRVAGFAGRRKELEALLRASSEWTVPPVRTTYQVVNYQNIEGGEDCVLLLEVEASERVHTTSDDEVYLRVGAETRHLSLEERLQLVYDKGEANYELTEVRDCGLDDLDNELLERYREITGTSLGIEDLLVAKGLAKGGGDGLRLNCAGVLLFARDPTIYYPKASLRFLRYEGTEALTGPRLNLVKDVRLELPLPHLIDEAIMVIGGNLRDFTRLGPDGKFQTIPEYPEFAWQEAVINAVCHRAYSIRGTDIQVRMFEDRLEVESPGKLPGIVRISNIREAHFSRNPRIARVLTELGYVRELGEGVDRMIDEMTALGLEPPHFAERGFSLVVTLYNAGSAQRAALLKKGLNSRQRQALDYVLAEGRITNKEYRAFFPDLSPETIRADLADMVDKGVLLKVGSKRGTYYMLK